MPPAERDEPHEFGAVVPPRAALVLTMHADGSHDALRVPIFVAQAGRADTVVASRYAVGGCADKSLTLRAMSGALNRRNSVVLEIDSRDVSSNLRLFHRKDPVDLRPTGNAFDIVDEIDSEVACRHGAEARPVEVPERIRERLSGGSKRKPGPFVTAYLVAPLRVRRSRK